MTKIPQANPLAENMELISEISDSINRVVSTGHYIQGSEVESFEREFSDYIGTAFAIGVASGTDAIKLGLCALGVASGDEVITVSHTAVATVAAIEQCGATPVLVDIDPSTFTMDVGKMQRSITAKTRAIIPVHLYGHPADIDLILQVANQYGIDVLEDCAQAHGASCKGKRVGGWGRLAGFSFYPTKNLGAIGDGGMIVTNDPDLAGKIRLLREYGWNNRRVSEISGFNSRLDELQAAILRVKLKHLDKQNELRRSFANVYTHSLSDCVGTPIEKPDAFHVYHLYVIRSLWRDQLRAFLAESEIGTGIHYPFPVHRQPAYAGLGMNNSLRLTEQAANEILSLPLYPQMTLEQVEHVAGKIREYFHKHALRSSKP